MGNEGEEFSGPKRRRDYVSGGVVCQCAINCSSERRAGSSRVESVRNRMVLLDAPTQGYFSLYVAQNERYQDSPGDPRDCRQPLSPSLGPHEEYKPHHQNEKAEQGEGIGGGGSQDFCPGAGRVARSEENPKHRLGDWHRVYLGSILAPASRTRQLAEHRQCTHRPVRS
jgi:hypothetical protein